MTKFLTLLAALLVSVSAWALDLDSAKQQGLVGEQMNGYLGLVASSHVEAAALVADINRKRKNHYQGIANKQNTALDNIQKIAGEKLIQRARSAGLYYQTDSGWER
tara:strand:- start:5063 stop:5380 length:318 start_codon:yes stop_codon:yes gene_type:complete